MSKRLSDDVDVSVSSEPDIKTSALEDWVEGWIGAFLHYRADQKDKLLYVGESVRNLFGIDPKRMIGKPLGSFISKTHPLLQMLGEIAFNAPFRGEIPGRLIAFYRPDGELGFLNLREREWVDPLGGPTLREGVGVDVSDFVNAEIALRQSELKYRRLVEGLGGDYVIFSHTPEGILTYVSPSVVNVLGFSAEEIVGRNWRELIGENFIGREFADRVQSEVDAGIRFHKFAVEITHGRGGTRLVEIQQSPAFDAEGRYVCMEGIAKDVTEPFQIQEELHQLQVALEQRVAERTAELSVSTAKLVASEARYRSVVEDQTEFICRWKPEGTYTFVNEAFCRYLGKRRDEMLKETFPPSIVKEDLVSLNATIAGLSPENPTVVTEFRIHHPDGAIRWTEWTNRFIFDGKGSYLEYQSVGRDISELKRAEDTIREKDDHLKRMGRLAMMGELIAGIAHEVHQPLHAAKLFSEAARRNLELNEPHSVSTAIECTREISESITRAAKIIRHLRDFTAAKITKLESLDMNELVQESLEILAHEARRAQVNISLEAEESLPTVRGDRIQLEQIIVQLLRNACEAMTDVPIPDRKVRIRTEFDDRNVTVSFQDSGCGEDSIDPHRLFDPFYSTKTAEIGMGLSICKSIAEAHKGSIRATPNSTSGMTFSLELPISKR